MMLLCCKVMSNIVRDTLPLCLSTDNVMINNDRLRYAVARVLLSKSTCRHMSCDVYEIIQWEIILGRRVSRAQDACMYTTSHQAYDPLSVWPTIHYQGV